MLFLSQAKVVLARLRRRRRPSTFFATVAGSKTNIQQAILQANPILEAFGNAKTLRNNNSSRFGKWVEVLFDADGIVGSKTDNYLLEKSRLSFVPEGERNYHSFYQLTKGASDEQRKKWEVMTPDQYHYLTISSTMSVPNMDDAAEFKDTLKALGDLGFSTEDVDSLYRIVSGILHLGNVQLVPDAGSGAEEGCRVQDTVPVTKAATLLGIPEDQLLKVITTRKIRGSTYASMTPAAAADSRDALAKALYSKLFDWIVQKINTATRPSSVGSVRVIGVLDIFGFEIFQKNSFEQLCINYANEQLQQHFTRHTFKLEQRLYDDEGIRFKPVEYVDNQPMLDLIDRKSPPGILQMIDEETRVPKGSDLTLMGKLNDETFAGAHPNYLRGRGGTKLQFEVRHYAGLVRYDADGWLAKNKDTLNDGLVEAVTASSQPLVKELFPNTITSGGRGPKKLTQGIFFSQQLTSLMEILNRSEPHYIRCIKPNSKKVSGEFEIPLCLHQLRCSGVFEAVQIRKKGYPFRFPHEYFFRRYSCVLSPTVRDDAISKSLSDGCQAIVSHVLRSLKGSSDMVGESLSFEPDDLQVGRTLVLYRSGPYRWLETQRIRVEKKAALMLQACMRGKAARDAKKSLRGSRRNLMSALRKPTVTLRELANAILDAQAERKTVVLGTKLSFSLHLPEGALEKKEALEVEEKIRSTLSSYMNTDLEFNNEAFTAMEWAVGAAETVHRRLGRTVQNIEQARRQVESVAGRRKCREDLRLGLADHDESRLRAALVAAEDLQLAKGRGSDPRDVSLLESAQAALKQCDGCRDLLRKATVSMSEADVVSALRHADRAGVAKDDVYIAADALRCRFSKCRDSLKEGLGDHDKETLEFAIKEAQALNLSSREDTDLLSRAEKELERQRELARFDGLLLDALRRGGAPSRVSRGKWDHTSVDTSHLTQIIENARAHGVDAKKAVCLIEMCEVLERLRNARRSRSWETVETAVSSAEKILEGSSSAVALPPTVSEEIADAKNELQVSREQDKLESTLKLSIENKDEASLLDALDRVDLYGMGDWQVVENGRECKQWMLVHKRRLRSAMQSVDDEALSEAVRVCETSGYEPDIISDARVLLEKLRKVVLQLDLAARHTDLDELTEALRDAEVLGLLANHNAVVHARERAATIRQVLQRAETVRDGFDVDVLERVVRDADDIGLSAACLEVCRTRGKQLRTILQQLEEATSRFEGGNLALEEWLARAKDCGLSEENQIVARARTRLQLLDSVQSGIDEAMGSQDLHALDRWLAEAKRSGVATAAVSSAEKFAEDAHSVVSALEQCVSNNELSAVREALARADALGLKETGKAAMALTAARKVLEWAEEIENDVRSSLEEKNLSALRKAVGVAETRDYKSQAIRSATEFLHQAEESIKEIRSATKAKNSQKLSQALSDADARGVSPDDPDVKAGRACLDRIDAIRETLESAMSELDISKLSRGVEAAEGEGYSSDLVVDSKRLRANIVNICDSIDDAVKAKSVTRLQDAIVRAEGCGFGAHVCTKGYLDRAKTCLARVEGILEELRNGVQRKNIDLLRKAIADAESEEIDSLDLRRGKEILQRVQRVQQSMLAADETKDVASLRRSLSEAEEIGIDSSDPVLRRTRKSLEWMESMRTNVGDAIASGDTELITQVLQTASDGGYKGDDVDRARALRAKLMDAYEKLGVAMVSRDVGDIDTWLTILDQLNAPKSNPTIIQARKLLEKLKEALARVRTAVDHVDLTEMESALTDADEIGLSSELVNRCKQLHADVLACHDQLFSAVADKDEAALDTWLRRSDVLGLPDIHPAIGEARECLNWVKLVQSSLCDAVEKVDVAALQKAIQMAESGGINSDALKRARDMLARLTEIIRSLEHALTRKEPALLDEAVRKAEFAGLSPTNELLVKARAMMTWLSSTREKLQRAMQSVDVAELTTAIEAAEGENWENEDVQRARTLRKNIEETLEDLMQASGSRCRHQLESSLQRSSALGLARDHPVVVEARKTQRWLVTMDDKLKGAVSQVDVSMLAECVQEAEEGGYVGDELSRASDLARRTQNICSEIMEATKAKDHAALESCLKQAQNIGGMLWTREETARAKDTLRLVEGLREELEAATRSADEVHLDAALDHAAAVGYTGDLVTRASELRAKIRQALEDLASGIAAFNVASIRAGLDHAARLRIPSTNTTVEQAKETLERVSTLHARLCEAQETSSREDLRHVLSDAASYGVETDIVQQAQRHLKGLDSCEHELETAVQARDPVALTAAIRKATSVRMPEATPLFGEAKLLLEKITRIEETVSSAMRLSDEARLQDAVSTAEGIGYSSARLQEARALKEKISLALDRLRTSTQSKDAAALRTWLQHAHLLGISDTHDTIVAARTVLRSVEDLQSRLNNIQKIGDDGKLLAVLEEAARAGVESEEIRRAREVSNRIREILKKLEEGLLENSEATLSAWLDRAKRSDLPPDHPLVTQATETLTWLHGVTSRLENAIAKKDVDALSEALAEAEKRGLDSELVRNARKLRKDLSHISTALRKAVEARDRAMITNALTTADAMGLSDSFHPVKTAMDMLLWISTVDDQIKDALPTADYDSLTAAIDLANKGGYKSGELLARATALRDRVREILTKLSDGCIHKDVVVLKDWLSFSEHVGIDQDHEVVRQARQCFSWIEAVHQSLNVATASKDHKKLSEELMVAEEGGLESPTVSRAQELLKGMRDARSHLEKGCAKLDEAALRRGLEQARLLEIVESDTLVEQSKQCLEFVVEAKRRLQKAIESKDEMELSRAIRFSDSRRFHPEEFVQASQLRLRILASLPPTSLTLWNVSAGTSSLQKISTSIGERLPVLSLDRYHQTARAVPVEKYQPFCSLFLTKSGGAAPQLKALNPISPTKRPSSNGHQSPIKAPATPSPTKPGRSNKGGTLVASEGDLGPVMGGIGRDVIGHVWPPEWVRLICEQLLTEVAVNHLHENRIYQPSHVLFKCFTTPRMTIAADCSLACCDFVCSVDAHSDDYGVQLVSRFLSGGLGPADFRFVIAARNACLSVVYGVENDKDMPEAAQTMAIDRPRMPLATCLTVSNIVFKRQTARDVFAEKLRASVAERSVALAEDFDGKQKDMDIYEFIMVALVHHHESVSSRLQTTSSGGTGGQTTPRTSKPRWQR
eukprot:Rmarinus@m.6382